MSIFPALIALVSIVGLVGDPKTVTDSLTDVVTSVGPASAADTFKEPIQDLTSSKGSAGILLIVGIATALWTASGYVGAFMRASNVIYEAEEGRSFIKLRPLQMLVTLVLILMLALVLVALVLTGPVAEQVGSGLGIGDTAVTVWDIAKWPALLAMSQTVTAVSLPCPARSRPVQPPDRSDTSATSTRASIRISTSVTSICSGRSLMKLSATFLGLVDHIRRRA